MNKRPPKQPISAISISIGIVPFAGLGGRSFTAAARIQATAPSRPALSEVEGMYFAVGLLFCILCRRTHGETRRSPWIPRSISIVTAWFLGIMYNK